MRMISEDASQSLGNCEISISGKHCDTKSKAFYVAETAKGCWKFDSKTDSDYFESFWTLKI